MDHQKRSLRLGAALILCALVLRLGSAGFFRSAADFLGKPNIAAFLIYLETGRKVRFSPSTEPVEVFARESAIPDFAKTAAVTEPAAKAETPVVTEPAQAVHPTASSPAIISAIVLFIISFFAFLFGTSATFRQLLLF